MLDYNNILQFMRLKGPLVPKDLVKTLEKDTIIIGAALAELASKGKICITSVKMGGSPFYYLPEQTPKLQDLNKYLNEKDQRAYETLKKEKVLKDVELAPLLRVSLRSIKDYAKAIEVNDNNQTHLFWVWYLMPKIEFVSLIKEKYFGMVTAVQSEKVKSNEIKPEEIKSEIPVVKPVEEVPQKASVVLPMPKTKVNDKIEEQRAAQVNQPQNIQPIKPIIKPIDGQVKKQQVSEIKPQAEIQIRSQGKQQEKQVKTQIEKKEIKVKEKPIIVPKEMADSETQTKINGAETEISDELFSKIKSYFNQNNIKYENINIIRKNKEFECVVEIPSIVGPMMYYCRVKTKKKANDGDLATTFVKGQQKQLPALFITTGEVTKKAKEMLNTEFKNMKIVFLD
ncbi:hypothetical protein HN695_06715 [Candidatus Woesearchaeota archaeon]|mgnify:FL=1|jgi:hypothetical protein|nr:hypothetical protein [Candidatus Woesearchaeota archaeon]MBT5271947.1 hypothetical protein [Candidatus Woesearchaeota archaeon]MBT6041059.1 hypothetical protein [Candidatus Woesearchaeota archaeon]MBT6336235.1 hypothetical protein [Candidatus Woesearchaeota archaeon]MBT7927998.1 hypothetical protein [Candidatus Woesearchaeota archaeon]